MDQPGHVVDPTRRVGVPLPARCPLTSSEGHAILLLYHLALKECPSYTFHQTCPYKYRVCKTLKKDVPLEQKKVISPGRTPSHSIMLISTIACRPKESIASGDRGAQVRQHEIRQS